MKPDRSTVYLVGAGPGDPGLMTVRGMSLLQQADVVVYDRLVSADLLEFARGDAELIDVGKGPGRKSVTQKKINQLLVERATAGRSVVRLKGGDPFMFGRGFEELVACRGAGVDCVVIPGVASVAAVPAAAGIPVTLRGVARSFAVITAKTGVGLADSRHDYDALSRIDTVVILMGRHKLSTIVDGLRCAGRADETPVACISHGTTPRQREVFSTLGKIVERVEGAALEAPMITVVGEVVAVSRATVDDAIAAIYGSLPV
jgi:uroporphyrin-III C-methyltransferase